MCVLADWWITVFVYTATFTSPPVSFYCVGFCWVLQLQKISVTLLSVGNAARPWPFISMSRYTVCVYCMCVSGYECHHLGHPILSALDWCEKAWDNKEKERKQSIETYKQLAHTWNVAGRCITQSQYKLVSHTAVVCTTSYIHFISNISAMQCCSKKNLLKS